MKISCTWSPRSAALYEPKNSTKIVLPIFAALPGFVEMPPLGFGSLSVVDRAARESRNPRTGETDYCSGVLRRKGGSGVMPVSYQIEQQVEAVGGLCLV